MANNTQKRATEHGKKKKPSFFYQEVSEDEAAPGTKERDLGASDTEDRRERSEQEAPETQPDTSRWKRVKRKRGELSGQSDSSEVEGDLLAGRCRV